MPYNWDKPFEVRDLRNGDWFWIHKDVWTDKRLTSSDKALYGTLAYFANGKTQEAFPSFKRLASFSGLSQRQVAISIKNLTTLGYVRKEGSPKKGKPNTYLLVKTSYAKSAYPNQPMQNSIRWYAPTAQVGMQNSTTNNNNIEQELFNNNSETYKKYESEINQIIFWAYERALIKPSCTRNQFLLAIERAIERVGYSVVYNCFAFETNAIAFLSAIKNL